MTEKIRLRRILRGMLPKTGTTDYFRGIKKGKTSAYVNVAVNNVWSDNCISSYEKIGFHTGSADFISGVLDSGCPVYVHRDDGQYRLVR